MHNMFNQLPLEKSIDWQVCFSPDTDAFNGESAPLFKFYWLEPEEA